MKKIIIFNILFALPVICFCQGRETAEKEFVAQLNSIINTTSSFHFALEDKFTVDSPFTIKKGILSVTLNFTNDSTFYKIRVAAPVRMIDRVGLDVYIILECKTDAVTYYQSADGKTDLIETKTTNLFHIGAVTGDGVSIMNKLNRELSVLKAYYR